MSGLNPADVQEGWRVWKAGPDGTCESVAGGSDGDALKILLAGVTRELEADPSALMLLGRGPWPGTAELLTSLAAMDLSGLILDEESASLLPPPHDAERIGFLPGFPGGGVPLCAYRLKGRSRRPDTAPPPVREALWSSIRERLSRRQAAGFRCVRVSGVAGAGKSHLLGSVDAWLAGLGVEVARAACLPSDTPGTFPTWRALLRGFFGSGLAGEIVRQGEESGLDPALVRSLGAFLDAPDTGAAALSPLQYKEIVPEFIAGLLARQASARESCGMIDDVQWMDEAGQQVTGILERRGVPLTLVMGRRGAPQDGDLVVGPMDREETRRLLAEHSGYERITDGLNAEVHRISGGLPLVAREVLTLLGQRKQLLRLGGTLDLAPGVGDAELRAGMELSERFRHLSPRLRGLLAACAVWREPFDREQAELTARAIAPELDFEGSWSSPLLGEFIVATPGRAGCFSFYHDLLRVAARSLLSEPDRRAAHASARDWMARKEGRSLAENAYHAREAGEAREAMELFDQAATAALDRFALREAREAARAAESLDPQDAGPDGNCRRARRCQVEGEAAFHSGMMAEAVALLEKSLVLYGVSPAPGRFPLGPKVIGRHLWLFARGRPWRGSPGGRNLGGASRAALMLAEIAYFQDDQPRSAAACITAMDLAVRDGESAALATLIAAIACPMSGKRPGWLASRYRSIARSMIRRVGDDSARAYIEHIGCLVDLGRAAWQETAACASRSAAFWKTQGHVRRMEEACIFGHYAEHFRGNLATAADWAGILEDSAMRRTDGQSQAWAGIVNSVHALAGVSTEKAEELSKRPAMDRADAITRLSAHVMRGLCAWRRGNPWQAAEHLATLSKEAPAAPSVSSTQFLYAEAALLVAEIRHWGPRDLREDPAFTAVSADVRKRARLFARGFRLGRPVWLAAVALGQAKSHPVRARRGFDRAERLAAALGMTLLHGRVICLRALALGEQHRFPDGLALLERCGATAEASRFHQLADKHEGRT